MTHETRDTDRELHDLFRAARRADAERIPPFGAMTQPAPARPLRRPSLQRLALAGATTGIAATALAVAGLWLLAPREMAPHEILSKPDLFAVQPIPPPPPPPAVAATREGASEAPAAPAVRADSAAFLETLGYVGSKPEPNDEVAQGAAPPAPSRFYQEALTVGHEPGVVDERFERGRGRFELVSVVGGVAGGMPGGIPADPRVGEEPGNTESYQPLAENEFLAVSENPLSTFSIDVDTASYANLRRFLVAGQLPPRDAVRIEELVNYFGYDYPPPSGDAPFSASVEVADCPWNPDHRLARIGLKGREIARGTHPGSNLVFLIDVSGSMNEPAKLPLLKSALALLVEQLTSRDRVAIVVYAGSSGLVLPSTSGDAKAEILDAIDRLEAGGSTNGGAGLRLAYRIARESFVPGGVNRVILATDGDFNVGVTDRGELLRAIEKDAQDGIFLTALGFGYANLKDDRLEHLADKGNGNYAYIDRLAEARKVLVEEMTGTLVTIAKDVKIQVEFNPLEVGAYRLIGYENRMLKKEDFNDDRKDAGEIGAGHTVTALYELAPPARTVAVPAVDPLKYQSGPAPTRAAEGGELFTLRLRYKDPEADASRLLSFPVVDLGLGLGAASADFKFAAAVAETGLLLRGSALAGAASFDSAQKLAAEGLGADERGLRAEFLDLLRVARALKGAGAGS